MIAAAYLGYQASLEPVRLQSAGVAMCCVMCLVMAMSGLERPCYD
jgi:hypothetical protein